MESESKKAIPVGWKVKHLACRFLQLISQRPHVSLTVNSCAAELNVCPNYLSRVCKTHFGRTASDLIHAQIVEEAKKCLSDPNAQTSEVAERLGFYDVSHFNRDFKKRTGQNITAFRNGL